MNRGIPPEKDPKLQRKKISHIPLKVDSEVQASNLSGTQTSQISSKPQVAPTVEIDNSLVKNLQSILKMFHEEIEVELKGLLTQTTLSEQEIGQCLAFLSDHQLIVVTTEKQSAIPKYRLSEDFDQKWSQVEQLQDEKENLK